MSLSAAFIRLARLGDERGIHEAHMRSIREVCSRVHTAEEIRGWGGRPFSDKWSGVVTSGTCWVVEWDDVVRGVGYIAISGDGGGAVEAHIFGLYLTPEVLGLGFGAGLMKLMLAAARAQGARLVTLDSSLNAHDFYLAFGFRDTGPMKTSEIGGSSVRGYPMSLALVD